jgi:hypothetical protein
VRNGPIKIPCFHQRLLLANKIHFVMQQTPDFSKGIREKMRRKIVIPLPIREVLASPCR